MSSNNLTDKSSNILNYFNRQFSYDSKNECLPPYNNLIQCFDKEKINTTNGDNKQTVSNIQKSHDNYNACFIEARYYFLCLTNEMSKFDTHS
jgi:hypothetical protein